MPGSSSADTQNSETAWKKKYQEVYRSKRGNFNQGVIGNIFNIPLQEYMFCL